MSDQVQKNIQVLKHWFETVCKCDINEIMKEWEEISTENYWIHDPSTPNLQPGRDKYLESFEQDMKNTAERRIDIEDMFGEEDKVVTLGTYEFVEVKTREKKKMMVIGISRFENGKIAEEWQVMAPVTSSSGCNEH